MEDTHIIQETRLRHVFDARLQYQTGMEVVVADEHRDGALIGSGDGEVQGELVSGTIRWSMYSGDCAYVYIQAGVKPPPGQHLCTVNPGGTIETDDGAQIWFDARGYGLRGADAAQPHIWTLTMGVQFKTVNVQYEWLNTELGVLVSRFDEEAGRALWQAYIPEPLADVA